MIELRPTYDGGFANSHGIIFSSVNSHGPIPQPVPIAPSYRPKPADSTLQSSDIDNVLDFNSNYSPFNVPPPPIHDIPAKPQSSFSSSGFTFAPLLIATSLPIPTQPIINHSTSNQINKVIHELNAKPSSSTTPSSSTQHSPNSPISNPVLKSQCGITNYTVSRVVGGAITQIGEHCFAIVV